MPGCHSGILPAGPEDGRTIPLADIAMVGEAANWLALFTENFMHEISDVPGTELLQEIGAMEIDGARADA